MVKGKGKLMGHYFLLSQKISMNESAFEIFPSNFLFVIPIGGTKDLVTKFDALDTFNKLEIRCIHFGYHGNQNCKFLSKEELTPVHMTIQ